jgi:hypothetical protein
MVSTSGNQKGGGYGSRQHVEKSVRTGSGSHNARPAGTAQIGNMWGDKATHQKGSTGYTGEKLHGPAARDFQPVPFGNEVALNVGKGGCGTGRTLYGQSGSQGLHGQPAPGNPPPKRGTFE